MMLMNPKTQQADDQIYSMDLNIFLIYHEKCNANTPNIDITDLPLLQDG